MHSAHGAVLQDEQPSGATADYADLTARLRNTTLSGGQLLTPGSVAGYGMASVLVDLSAVNSLMFSGIPTLLWPARGLTAGASVPDMCQQLRAGVAI